MRAGQSSTGSTSEQTATSVETDEVVFRLADPDHGPESVRLWSDVDLGGGRGPGLALEPVDGGWELRLALPELDALEYLFEVDGALGPDPGNPDVVDGAFGPHSWLALPGYVAPRWLAVEPIAGTRRPVRVDRTPVGRITAEVWQPAGTPDSAPLPMLVAHDGPEMDRFGELTRYVATMIASGDLPFLRVALVSPGDRDQWYAAAPAYAQALHHHVLPRLARRFASHHRPVLTGQSLGAVAALHAGLGAPDTYAGLLLQSGSFFTDEHDSQESGWSKFADVSGFVSEVHATDADLARLPPIAMTCGTAEENLANNRHLRDRLRTAGVQVSWGEARQGHTWTCWRDLLDPHLTRLLQTVWGTTSGHPHGRWQSA